MTAWKPTAKLENLQARAKILAQIRAFFASRNVWEVETPLLCQASVTDPYIQSFGVYPPQPMPNQPLGYLQTSPEYAMKRLLAAGSGAIYQICKAFRYAESGRLHNPEFTLLEWYRPGFTHHELMDETEQLLNEILKIKKAERISYQQLFEKFIGINPHTTTITALKQRASNLGIKLNHNKIARDKDDWLLLLMSHVIEPKLGLEQPLFVYDFPASQAALARLRWEGTMQVAERFEVYINGIELANGFHELTDSKEQRQRFLDNCQYREKLGLPAMPLDQYFLAALEQGLPNCAGIALGVDRLLMLATNTDNIASILSFTPTNT